MTTYTLYRVNTTKLAVEQIAVTDIDSEHTDGALRVEVTPEGVMKPLDMATYYAETESEAAKMLLGYIAAEIEKAENDREYHKTQFLAAQDRASLLCERMRKMAMDGHEVPVTWAGGVDRGMNAVQGLRRNGR